MPEQACTCERHISVRGEEEEEEEEEEKSPEYRRAARSCWQEVTGRGWTSKGAAGRTRERASGRMCLR